MPSSNKTDYLKLNKWLNNDTLQVEDFIDDNEKIDAEFLARGVNVKWFGAIGDGVANDTTTIQNALNNSISNIPYFPKGTYIISDTINIPLSIKEINFHKEAKILQTVDKPLFTKTGSYETAKNITSGSIKGSDTVVVDSVTGLAIGDWVYIYSEDLITTTKAPLDGKYGMMRQIFNISGNDIKVDATLYRNLSTSPKLRKINFAPEIHINGGVFEFQEPLETKFRQHFMMTFVENPRFSNVCIQNGGGAGIDLINCLGGSYENSKIDNLLDNTYYTGHWGYGVSLSGATRGFQFLSGEVSRVRHAITTARWLGSDDMVRYGEAESCYYGAVWVHNCTNAGLDTHEEGYGITMNPNISGCEIGINIRTDATSVTGGQIINCKKSGITIQDMVKDAVINSPTVTNTGLSNSGTEGDGIQVSGVAHIINPIVLGFKRSGIALTMSGKVDIIGGYVDGIIPSSNDGISINTSGNRIFGTKVNNCNNGIIEFAGKTDNEWHFVEFKGNNTNEVIQPTYTHRKITPYQTNIIDKPIRVINDAEGITFENVAGDGKVKFKTAGSGSKDLGVQRWDGVSAYENIFSINPNGLYIQKAIHMNNMPLYGLITKTGSNFTASELGSNGIGLRLDTFELFVNFNGTVKRITSIT